MPRLSLPEPDLQAASYLHHLIIRKDYTTAAQFFHDTAYRLECIIAREVDSQMGLLHVCIANASPEDWSKPRKSNKSREFDAAEESRNPQAFIEAFLKWGIYVDLPDKKGRTILQLAALRNLLPVASLILEKGKRRDEKTFEKEIHKVYGMVVKKMEEMREAGDAYQADAYRQMACLLHGNRETGVRDDVGGRGKGKRVNRPVEMPRKAPLVSRLGR